MQGRGFDSRHLHHHHEQIFIIRNVARRKLFRGGRFFKFNLKRRGAGLRSIAS